jgi:hypothetical protein
MLSRHDQVLRCALRIPRKLEVHTYDSCQLAFALRVEKQDRLGGGTMERAPVLLQ